MLEEILIETPGQGLYEITSEVQGVVVKSGVTSGLCTVFIQHTSASLIIQENAASSAKQDLEKWLSRLVPEADKLYTHTDEGPDDMPSHIKSILTQVSISIPISGSCVALGAWQGIYLWEHRRRSHQRTVLVQILAD